MGFHFRNKAEIIRRINGGSISIDLEAFEPQGPNLTLRNPLPRRHQHRAGDLHDPFVRTTTCVQRQVPAQLARHILSNHREIPILQFEQIRAIVACRTRELALRG